MKSLFAVVSIAASVWINVAGQTQLFPSNRNTTTPTTYTPPRTLDGQPDLQGVWTSGPLIDVPFERAANLGTRAVLTDKEFAEIEAASRRQVDADLSEFILGGAQVIGSPTHWLIVLTAERLHFLAVTTSPHLVFPVEPCARQAVAFTEGAGESERYVEHSFRNGLVPRGTSTWN